MNPAEEQLARQLWALGDAVRLRILQRLPRTAEDCCDWNVSKLAEELGLSQPTLSHHLRILRQAGVVSYTKKCRDCFYWVREEDTKAILDAMHALLKR
ncbi:MAG: helix-turn-helix transcriptional regulator [Opitutales bacterium]|nr:helix-turn-helix transcriptional regulator [Opitutales bacterium]